MKTHCLIFVLFLHLLNAETASGNEDEIDSIKNYLDRFRSMTELGKELIARHGSVEGSGKERRKRAVASITIPRPITTTTRPTTTTTRPTTTTTRPTTTTTRPTTTTTRPTTTTTRPTTTTTRPTTTTTRPTTTTTKPTTTTTTTSSTCGVPAVTPSVLSSLGGIGPYIVGGNAAIPYSWPWQILILVQSPWGTSTCGGSLVNSQWVVTAAHCVDGQFLSYIYVFAGVNTLSATGSYEQPRRVNYGVIHPNYNTNNNDYDIALLRLSTAVNITRQVSPVCLPQSGWTVAAGTYCTATGWGLTSVTASSVSNVLNQVRVPIVSTATCNSASYYNGAITPRMICAGVAGKDSCQGDSGGPLVCQDSTGRWILTGVTSWGSGCGSTNKPGIYTNVASVVSWMNSYI